MKITLYGTQPQIQIAAGLLLTRSSTIVYEPKEMKTSSVMLCVCPASLTTRRCILQTIYFSEVMSTTTYHHRRGIDLDLKCDPISEEMI